ncbi:class I SAM-dependent methyltransferase [Cyanobium sp. WAJ14-Wanaka]|uniref:class I SAM-dependent methyltransferase n=1 Tax=Cyanobium sp. WAJ14-Wanaka TaxID=2823725 RepID=UPI0020CBC110|nr:class I SAM-dependent methyltransferase [Cyanobium sp. WAJ14-Wanaka]MCP9775662.1 methyltransferase domain-containing protein [Cyanobium sp. WAJ14-Wanaka]
MAEIDFMGVLHKSTQRDYLARVNDPDYPKAKAAELAKQFDHDYWDGDRRICYGGYRYMEGRWEKVARALVDHYQLPENPKILDIGCGKGFLLYDFLKVIPGAEIYGIDLSPYAIANSKEEIRDRLQVGNATQLPWPDDHFDLVISINTLHCLHAQDLHPALCEMERVGKEHKYLCVESWRNQAEKANLLYWQVTCEAFNTPEAWHWWFKQTCYSGDHSFIYFE